VTRPGPGGVTPAAEVAREGGMAPAGKVARLGRAGLAATGLSLALTFTVAVLGPSLMEPPLPGRRGQPPWSFPAHPSPYLVVALTAAAIVVGTGGLALTIWAARRGWRVSPGLLLAAGVLAAVALALVPPFGSSDHLSYAAYGRMAVTGHDPYTTTPAALARLGDPVARAVEDWRSSPSVYGALATGGQALASAVGGTSVRLTVFLLDLLNVVAFALTGLLLHRLARGDRRRQFRAALLWTANPLLLQVLIAGAHVDSQAVLFAVAALAAYRFADSQRGYGRQALAAALAGGLVGLGFAVKATMVLVGIGLALAWLLAVRRRTWRAQLAIPVGLAAGFAVTAGTSLVVWGVSSLAPALRAGSFVSIGSPWRAVRSALRVGIGESAAEDTVKIAAVVLAVALAALMVRSMTSSRDGRMGPGGAGLAASVVVAVALAWLFAWPYVLPWYDALGWALLVVLPWSRLDWLLLARTAALAIGYLPARGVAVPAGLGWLETVIRTAVTPAILLAATVTLVVTLWPGRGWRWPAEDGWRPGIPFRSP
jgi:hypothetical protein